MTCCNAQGAAICQCGTFNFPLVISNPPGLDAIAYRPGDYSSFRHALLLPLAGENALTQPGAPGSGVAFIPIWRPGVSGDLALQMIEWWAYLSDILTFYNERVANESYLRTAMLPESVNRLIRLLGYRPRPGIGGGAVLGAIATGPDPFTLPQGFQVQSKPGPGVAPQIFELESDVTITPPVAAIGSNPAQGVAALVPTPPTTPPSITANNNKVVLQGSVSSVKAGDHLLFLPTDTTSAAFALAIVSQVTHATDPQVGPYTTFTLLDPYSQLSVVTIKSPPSFRILRPKSFAQVWQYQANDDLVLAYTSNPSILTVQLNAIVRGLQPGDPIVIEYLNPSSGSAVSGFPCSVPLINSSEIVWYAQPTDPSNPSTYVLSPPSSTLPTSLIPIPHTVLQIPWSAASQPPDSSTSPTDTRPYYLVRYGYSDVGTMIVLPSSTVGGLGASVGDATVGSLGDATGGTVTLQTADSSTLPVSPKTPVLVEDVNGHGAQGVVDGPSTLQLVDPVPVLLPPLRTLFNLLNVTRGKSVLQEVLGSGNALVSGQDFTLQNMPVTYLQSADSLSGNNYSSTVQVWVNQVEWYEVPSFYNQPPSAQVFITREDEQGQTHVVFGDGTNGALLPTGVNNVVANYRFGSGAQAPAAGSLTVILKPWPGLLSIRNPVAAGGGSDPDPPNQVRGYAPQSVLTFNRAVSLDDFQTIAAQTPGVTRAKAAFSFDPLSQRPRVTVWVGDDSTAVADVQAAFAATADPNRLPRVVAAKAMVMSLSLTVVTDPSSEADAVVAAVRTAIIDPDAGVLGLNVVGIGQSIYDSGIYAACMAVPGVVAIQALSISVLTTTIDPIYVRRIDLLNAAITSLLPTRGLSPIISFPPACSRGNTRHDPGEGSYLVLPDSDSYLTLAQETAS